MSDPELALASIGVASFDEEVVPRGILVDGSFFSGPEAYPRRGG